MQRRTALGIVVAVAALLAIVGVGAMLTANDDPLDFLGNQQDSDQLAPGVRANGSVNLTRLLDAHQTRLREQGFVTETTVTSTADGSVVATSDQRVRATVNLSEVVVQQRQGVTGGQNATVSAYSNETRTYVRVDRGGNESFSARERVQADTVPPISQTTAAVLGRAEENMSVENVTGSGDQRRITLTSTVTQTSGPTTVESDLTMVVDGQGVIHSLDVTTTQPGGGARLTTSYDLQQLGVREVQKPGWVAEVPANATTSPVPTAS